MTARPSHPGPTRGFTLIEMLVVISIIALLLGILLPVLGSARETARTVQCLSNFRQWGLGMAMFMDERDDYIPDDGPDRIGSELYQINGQNVHPLASDIWWGNVVTPYVSQPSYREVARAAIDRGDPREVPVAGQQSIFLCPSAQMPSAPPDQREGPFPIEFSGSVLGETGYYYFNYAANSKLKRNSPAIWPSSNVQAIRRFQITQASSTVAMVELRSTVMEFERNRSGQYVYPDGDVISNDSGRSKADWQRMASRHGEQCHFVFFDGHAAGRDVAYADEMLDQDAVVPEQMGRNKSDLIWTPLAPARD